MSHVTIGYLTSAAPGSAASADGFQQLRQRLEETGYRDGKDVTFAHRSTQASGRSFAELAAELVRLPVDVLVVGDSRAVPVAASATSTIPIVMAVGGDVVGLGLVASLSQPGRNLTGLTDRLPGRSLDVERLELLLQALPDASRVGVLRNGSHQGVALAWNAIQAAAPTVAADLVGLVVQDAADLDGAFQEAVDKKVDALCVLPDPLTNLHAVRIVQLAAHSRLPAMYGTKLFVNAGGLMSYGIDRAAMFRRAADYVHRILSDPDPTLVSRLPIEPPPVLDFAINLSTAQSLGLDLRPAIQVAGTGV
jgi:putative ABC transport system substrate-binding protein